MSEFTTVDLMNYAVYGNETDSEWDEIRNYIESNSQAKKEYEEIKKNLPEGRKSRYQENRKITPGSVNENQGEGSGEKKSWFGLF